ncbi:hypothetical protein [Clostridium estertheticum]|uniref:hypothetical protein n=1 Tax=Clostridium estertheticum TaxID=238834 RepID=UPI001C0D0941|nr:hypothetical protein [Clostridium estertheticum]MBU3173295.1 hypothetical protein [Clostridium estertheticum]
MGIIISVFVLLFVTFSIINLLQPLVIYFEVRQAGRTAMLQIEVQGGITQTIRDEIKSSISFYNYDSSNLIITPVTDVTPTTLPAYGSKVDIDLDYQYRVKTYSLNGLSIVVGSEIKHIGSHFSTTSKKAP